MIRPSPFSLCWCSRRAFARSSRIPMSDESSTYSGASDSRWQASRIFGQRFSATRPLRSSSPRMRACEATKRCASSASDISSENSATGLPWSSAAFSAMLRDERRLAHRRTGGEDDQVARLEAAGDLVEVLEAGRRAGERRCARARADAACPSRRAAPRRPSGSPSGGRRGRPRGCRARPTRPARAPAPRGSSTFAWICCVVVSRRRSSALLCTMRAYSRTLPAAGAAPGERVDRRRSADLLQLARLPQLLGDGEHVDLAALLVQLEHRPVDRRVLLAVEVLRLEPLVDDEPVERRVGEQDRAEHRLLGLEVMRWKEGLVVLLERGHSAPETSEPIRRCRSARVAVRRSLIWRLCGRVTSARRPSS